MHRTQDFMLTQVRNLMSTTNLRFLHPPCVDQLATTQILKATTHRSRSGTQPSKFPRNRKVGLRCGCPVTHTAGVSGRHFHLRAAGPPLFIDRCQSTGHQSCKGLVKKFQPTAKLDLAGNPGMEPRGPPERLMPPTTDTAEVPVRSRCGPR